MIEVTAEELLAHIGRLYIERQRAEGERDLWQGRWVASQQEVAEAHQQIAFLHGQPDGKVSPEGGP
jgi:hypothetical protein